MANIENSQRRSPSPESLALAAFYSGLAYAFIQFSDIHELITLSAGFKPYILIIVTVPMLVLVFLGGGLRRTLQWPAAKYWTAFTLWTIVALPFSSWKSGSLPLTVLWIRAELPILFAIAGCAITLRQFGRLLSVLAAAAVVSVIAGRFFAGFVTGRLELAGTTLADPNDYAAHLIFVLPFVLLVALTPGRSVATRLLAGAVTLYGLLLVLSTGSRGGLIALILVLLVCLWKLRPRQKLAVAGIAGVLVIAATAVLPKDILVRLATTFQSQELRSGVSVADESKESRSRLLKQSIVFTLRHPLFGVGMGQFPNYEGMTALKRGERGYWHETHNSFTQVSSELGLPALLFYVAAIVATFRMLNAVYREAGRRTATIQVRQIRLTAFCLLLSLIGFGAASFFLSLAYRFYLPGLTGMTIAFLRAVRNWESAAATDVPEPLKTRDAVYAYS